MFPVQTPAQSKVSCKLKPGCLSIYPAGSWKAFQDGNCLHSFSGHPALPDHRCSEKVIPCIQLETNCLLFAHHAPLWIDWLHLIKDLLVSVRHLWLSPSKVIASPAGRSSQPFLIGQELLSVILEALCWTHFGSLVPFYCCRRDQSWTQDSRCGLASAG